MKPTSKEIPEPGSLHPAGSAAPVCQWMMCAKDWRECGQPATHEDPTTSLKSCDYHAAYYARVMAPMSRLVRLNDQSSPTGREKPKGNL